MEIVTKRQLEIFTGTHHPALAQSVAKKLGVKLSKVHLSRFANGEVRCQIDESVRGKDLFIMQTHSPPVNDAIMEQALLIETAKRASARHITAVCPSLGYARQDRKSTGREPISAKLVIDILKIAGADRIVSVDLHSGQVQGFFDGPFDHLIAMPALITHLKKVLGKKCIIVSPDAGRAKLAQRYSRRLHSGLAIIHKKRSRGNDNGAEALHLIGDDVKGQHCVIIDDMIDGAGTVCAATTQLKRHGAKTVVVLATHGFFSPPAAERLQRSGIDRIIITDTLPLSEQLKKLQQPKIEIASISGLIAEAIAAIFEDRSLSALFDGENQS